MFFVGDAAFGPKNIIWAVEHGHQAAISVHKYCQGEDVADRLADGLTLETTKMGIHEWSYSNDYGYENVFERQIQALANEKDVVIGISTGGTSKNVINALRFANTFGCKVIGFSGKDGGDMNAICDVNIVVPSEDTPRIQEMHIFIGHTICHLIDQEFTN